MQVFFCLFEAFDQPLLSADPWDGESSALDPARVSLAALRPAFAEYDDEYAILLERSQPCAPPASTSTSGFARRPEPSIGAARHHCECAPLPATDGEPNARLADLRHSILDKVANKSLCLEFVDG